MGEEVVQLCTTNEGKGYCRVLLDYLSDAATGPRKGCGSRTTLFGLQRPPLRGGTSCLRLEKDVSLDELVRYVFPFLATNAKDQLAISVDHANVAIAVPVGVRVIEETKEEFTASVDKYWNVVTLPRKADAPVATPKYPLAAHFISKLFPLGHIKSTLSDDENFLKVFSASSKWLRVADGQSEKKQKV